MIKRIKAIKNFAVLAAAVLSLSVSSVYAQTFKISTLYPDGTTVVVALKKAGKDIEAKTEGRIKFKFYPGGVMGDDRAVQRKIRVGQLHGALTQGGALAKFYKDSQVYNVPLAFRSFDEVDYVRERMDAGIVDGFEKNGWVSFGLVDGGFAYVMANEPINNVADLRKQKLWLPANDPASEKASKAFELSPIVLNIGEVLTSLQTGAINAIAAPPVAALTLQWYSRVKHMTDVPLLYTFGLMTIQDRHFNKASTEDQLVIREVFAKVFKKLDVINRQDSINAFNEIKNQGINVLTPSTEDIADWRSYADKATVGLVAEGEFSQEILDELNKYLAEFRTR